MEFRAAGYDGGMTAPGQEPDEVLSARPDEKPTTPDEPDDVGTGGTDAGEDSDGDSARDEPDLKAIGDAHLPDDLREDVRERAEAERAEQQSDLEQQAEKAKAERAAEREAEREEKPEPQPKGREDEAGQD